MGLLRETDIKQLTELTTFSMEKFCEGYSMMFEKTFRCKLKESASMTTEEMKTLCGQFLAVNTVNCMGPITGRFLIVLDRPALFTLGGATVMLPVPRIIDLREKGTKEDISYISDSISEVGNLIVGDFAVGFRTGSRTTEGLDDNEYLQLDLPVPIGDIDPALQDGVEQCNVLTYQMDMEGFDPFQVYVAFPRAD